MGWGEREREYTGILIYGCDIYRQSLGKIIHSDAEALEKENKYKGIRKRDQVSSGGDSRVSAKKFLQQTLIKFTSFNPLVST